MVHFRLNEREVNPNPYINFITALPSATEEDTESARQYLRALAAQVKPIMKAHGFTVNSFEEYEHNAVFAGRNWENGETVELVLRRPGGSFLPTSWLMSTLCHELAHILHMNHGPDFQRLWTQLRQEVRHLQDQGYYGDGYWSSGTRLSDNATIEGTGDVTGDLPEFMCGGAQARKRPTGVRRRRGGARKAPVPSNHTGAQTSKRRKAGGRVTSKYAFSGEGVSLDEEVAESKGKAKGAGFGKRTQTKSAREERALAAERRIQALQAGASIPNAESCQDEESSDEEIEFVETDADRRRTLLESEKDDEQLKAVWDTFDDDFIFLPKGTSTAVQAIASSSLAPSDQSKGKAKEQSGIEKFVKSEKSEPNERRKGGTSGKPSTPQPQEKTWTCSICTLENEPLHLACSACTTPRGNTTYNP